MSCSKWYCSGSSCLAASYSPGLGYLFKGWPVYWSAFLLFNSTLPEYLNLFLKSYAYWSQIVSLNEDNFRPRVNAESLKCLVVPNCSIEIQNNGVKISNGEYLDNYDELFDKVKQLEKCNDLEEEYKPSLKHASMLKEALFVDAFELATRKTNAN